MYLDRVESIEHAKFRALSQILLTTGAEDQSSGIEAFEDYMRKAFPNAETKKKKKHSAMMDALKEWVGLGPLGVVPMPSLTAKGKSKMVSRIAGIEKGAVATALSKVGGIRSR